MLDSLSGKVLESALGIAEATAENADNTHCHLRVVGEEIKEMPSSYTQYIVAEIAWAEAG